MTPPERPEVRALAEKMVAAGSPLNVLTEAGWRIVLMALRDRFPELAREVPGAAAAEPLRGALSVSDEIEETSVLGCRITNPDGKTIGWLIAPGFRAALEATTPSTPEPALDVWCVWTESGEYEQFSRDLRGIFASRELAEAHAAQLHGDADAVKVVEDRILDEVPVSVPHVRYAAHIWPDGTEDTGLGYHRESKYSTWSNELRPMDRTRMDPWNPNKDPRDMYIEVIGSDEPLVAAEYARQLATLRLALTSEPRAAAPQEGEAE